jgi:hypothetical protein
LSFGISVHGGEPPKPEQVLLNTAIQLVAEWAQSLACTLFYVVVKGHPAMSVPLLRMRGFVLIMSLITMAVWCDCITVVLPACLIHHAHSNMNWEFLTQAFVKDLNTSALCETFPEAVGFAKYYECGPTYR